MSIINLSPALIIIFRLFLKVLKHGSMEYVNHFVLFIHGETNELLLRKRVEQLINDNLWFHLLYIFNQ